MTRRRALIASEGRRQRPGIYFQLPDGTLIWADDENPILPIFLLGDIRLADLRRAAGRVLRYWAEVPMSEPLPDGHEGLALHVVDMHPDDFWPLANHHRNYDVHQVRWELLADDEGVTGITYVETSKELSEELAETIARQSAAASGAELVEVESASTSATDQVWRIRIRLEQRGRTAKDLVIALEATEAVLDATRSGDITYDTGLALLAAGHTGWLVGRQETQWLEAKSEPWNLDTDAGKIELAQDVARFANAAGGLLVVGASTKKSTGVDTIVKVRGLAPGLLNTNRLEATLDERIYPPVDGLSTTVCPGQDEREVVVIGVPPQPDRSKPFLVHGVVAGGRVEGRFFSIVRRRGERSIPVTAREVHAWLAAGRQQLHEGAGGED